MIRDLELSCRYFSHEGVYIRRRVYARTRGRLFFTRVRCAPRASSTGRRLSLCRRAAVCIDHYIFCVLFCLDHAMTFVPRRPTLSRKMCSCFWVICIILHVRFFREKERDARVFLLNKLKGKLIVATFEIYISHENIKKLYV